MTGAHTLRRNIHDCELQHEMFKELQQELFQRIDDALDGGPPASECVVGPSRVGKSMLIKMLTRRYPSTKLDGARRIPLLVVELPSPISPREMPKSVLEALGVSTARGNSADLFMRMKRLLEMAQTKVMLFEEASHIVEVGAKMTSRAAGDWFKQVMDRLGITIILFGVPHLEKLYESNEQLRLRSQARRVFRPYDYLNAKERIAFASCVRAYAEMFASAGYPIAVPFERFVQHCYLLSSGLIGVLGAFMNRLAYNIKSAGPRPLTFEDCNDAVSKIGVAGHPDCPAFTREEVTPIELNQAYVHLMQEAGLTMKRTA